ncbi:MAG: hypothetical protein AB7S71_24210 [Dongiaceae bacterium]
MRQERWTQMHGNCRIIQGSQMEKELAYLKQIPGLSPSFAESRYLFGSWNAFPFTVKNKLRQAIELAPLMVREALNALRQHLVYDEPTRSFDNWMASQKLAPDPGQTETGLALTKYFNLYFPGAGGPSAGAAASSSAYWKYVRGIVTVYERIRDGMAGNFEVVVEYLPTSAGQVSNAGGKPGPVSPIRAIFGFADEYGHVEWTTNTGDPHRIKIGSRYLCDSQTRAEDLARTIVHEASHKFARTKDILYKSSSFAKDLDAFVEAPDAQQAVSRAARPDKPLQPLTGFADRAAKTIIADERYLENADSYAWTARRLWKRAGRPSA